MSDFDGLGPEGSYYEAKARQEEADRKRKLDASYPLLISILYLILGFAFGLWHPGWLIFLTIPMHYMHFRSRMDRFTNPVMITLIYLAIGCFFDIWHPTWMIFLLIPLAEIHKKR